MEDNKINERIMIFIDSLKMNYKELSKYLNVDQSAISRIKANKQTPYSHLEKLNKLGLNLNWLYTGVGKMIVENDTIGLKIFSKELIHQGHKKFNCLRDLQIFNMFRNMQFKEEIIEYEQYVLYGLYISEFKRKRYILTAIGKKHYEYLGPFEHTNLESSILIMYYNEFAKLVLHKIIKTKDEDILVYRIYNVNNNLLIEFTEKDDVYNEVEFVVSEIDVTLTDIYKKLGVYPDSRKQENL